MSYFAGSPSGDISEWNASIAMLLEQGYPPSTISLAIPYFFGNTPWADMCASCPDIAPASNNCSGTLIVGKLVNQRLGALAVERGIGGVFPWMLNYDSSGSTGGCVDDSLFQWLRRGLLSKPVGLGGRRLIDARSRLKA